MRSAPNDTDSAEGDRVLFIDDDVEFCELLAAHRGNEGVHRALEAPWCAVILDVMMPGMDGFEVLKEIRRKSSVPVLMLNGQGDETDVVVDLKIGADDYIPKTSSMRQLLARLRAIFRASFGSVLTLSLGLRVVFVGASTTHLRPSWRSRLASTNPAGPAS